MSNPVDDAMAAGRAAEAARRSMIEETSPRFIEALQRLTHEIALQRLTTELAIDASNRQIQLGERQELTQRELVLALRDVRDELAALRAMRVNNGHAKDDDLTEGG